LLQPIADAARSGCTALVNGESVRAAATAGFWNGVHSVTADVEHVAAVSVIQALQGPNAESAATITDTGLLKSAGKAIYSDLLTPARQNMLGMFARPVALLADASWHIASTAASIAQKVSSDLTSTMHNLQALSNRVSTASKMSKFLRKSVSHGLDHVAKSLGKFCGHMSNVVTQGSHWHKKLMELETKANAGTSLSFGEQFSHWTSWTSSFARDSWQNFLHAMDARQE
jgi:hypothetical protein